MTRKIKKPVINAKPKRPGQGKERRKSRLKLKTKLKIELSTISTVMEVKGQEMMRIRKHVNLTVQGGREVPRQDGVNESKIERTPRQYDCECKSLLPRLRLRVSRSSEFSSHASHVTSQFGLIFPRRTMSTQHWSSLVMLQMNTSREQSV